MSIPKDGHYTARVQLDTGGQWELYVRIKDGKLFTTLGVELLPEACSEFQEVNTARMVRAWPDDAAMELEALRAANAGLVEKVKRLEEVGDGLAEIAGKFGHGLFVHERRDAWKEAKGQP